MVNIKINKDLLSDHEKKLIGIEFDGVMCSTTKEDQDALLAIYFAYQMQGVDFQPTVYKFQNGNELLITKDNIERFSLSWIPARQKFFATKKKASSK
jgi:hypothetical protein